MDFYTDGETPKPEASGVVEASLEDGRRMEVNSSSQSDAKSSLHILAHTSKAGTVQAVTNLIFFFYKTAAQILIFRFL